jgi:hypothetical protein
MPGFLTFRNNLENICRFVALTFSAKELFGEIVVLTTSFFVETPKRAPR